MYHFNILTFVFFFLCTINQLNGVLADKCSSFGDCNGLSLVSRITADALGWPKGTYCTSLWGWTDPRTSRNYIITTCEPGQSIIDITNIDKPVAIAKIMGHAGGNFRWRDVKIYNNHAFFVSDALMSKVQIVDLQSAVDQSAKKSGIPVLDETLVYEGGGIFQSHNIEINTASGYAYTVGGGNNCMNGLHMINIKDPKNPTFAGCYYDVMNQYIHDAKCVTYDGSYLGGKYKGREICFGFAVFNLLIIDVTDKSNVKLLSRLTWPNAAYIHQGWLTTDRSFLVVDDERDETGDGIKTFIVDVRDLDVPRLAHIHVALGETFGDHNQYVLKIGSHDYTFQANYAGGIRVLRINRGPVDGVSDDEILSMEEVAFFDTNKRDDNDMLGTWSVYPYFSDQQLVVTFDMETGFYILKRTFDDSTPAIPYKNSQSTPSPTAWTDCPKISTEGECTKHVACLWDDDWVATEGWTFGCYNAKPIKPTEPYRAPGGKADNCIGLPLQQCKVYPACTVKNQKCAVYVSTGAKTPAPVAPTTKKPTTTNKPTSSTKSPTDSRAPTSKSTSVPTATKKPTTKPTKKPTKPVTDAPTPFEGPNTEAPSSSPDTSDGGDNSFKGCSDLQTQQECETYGSGLAWSNKGKDKSCSACGWGAFLTIRVNYTITKDGTEVDQIKNKDDKKLVMSLLHDAIEKVVIDQHISTSLDELPIVIKSEFALIKAKVSDDFQSYIVQKVTENSGVFAKAVYKALAATGSGVALTVHSVEPFESDYQCGCIDNVYVESAGTQSTYSFLVSMAAVAALVFFIFL